MHVTIENLTVGIIDQLRNEALDADDSHTAELCRKALYPRRGIETTSRVADEVYPAIIAHLNSIAIVTPGDLRTWGACWSDDRIASYLRGREFVTAREIAGDEAIAHNDRMWVLTRALAHGPDIWRTFDFSLWVARRSLEGLTDEWRAELAPVFEQVSSLRGSTERAAHERTARRAEYLALVLPAWNTESAESARSVARAAWNARACAAARGQDPDVADWGVRACVAYVTYAAYAGRSAESATRDRLVDMLEGRA